MKESTKQRALFATKFAAIASTVGSAVGLGNIWRFPYEAGTHGGGAFLICYLAFVILIGVPVLCAEYCLGRATRSNIFGAYRAAISGRLLHKLGYLGIISSLLILSFYAVVAGWTLEYCIESLMGKLDFSNPEEGHQQYLTLTTGWRPVIWTVIFMLCNAFILLKGVTKGIERVSNIFMPVLFVLLLLFCINSLTLPGAKEGIDFLFVPDFSKISSKVLLGALGQAFFSLSLGLGCMITYASYFSDSTKLAGTALLTALLDSAVAILAGIIIFPAVFSFGVSPQAGPTLVFEVLPNIFSQLTAGGVWSTLFFLLLFIASITSTVSVSEISVTYLCEERKLTRTKAVLISTVISLAGGVLCAMSFGPLRDFTICDRNIFDIFDYVTSNIFLPIGGMLCSLVVGWALDRKTLKTQFTNNGSIRFRFLPILVFFLKWICPAAIFLVFLDSIGII
ncbi:MAG: sodium-dependent transporter [Muribaculaceae bacterium]|nr:sodium-dependent transporter [Muribaculaceae bacterium]